MWCAVPSTWHSALALHCVVPSTHSIPQTAVRGIVPKLSKSETPWHHWWGEWWKSVLSCEVLMDVWGGLAQVLKIVWWGSDGSLCCPQKVVMDRCLLFVSRLPQGSNSRCILRNQKIKSKQVYILGSLILREGLTFQTRWFFGKVSKGGGPAPPPLFRGPWVRSNMCCCKYFWFPIV